MPSTRPVHLHRAGEPWTVQSWLASVAYAAAERTGGVLGLRLLVLVVFWPRRLAAVAAHRRPASIARPAQCWSRPPGCRNVGSGASVPTWWAFIGIGLVWLALDGRVPRGCSLPFMWVWVNATGPITRSAPAVLTCFSAGALRPTRSRRPAVSPWRASGRWPPASSSAYRPRRRLAARARALTFPSWRAQPVELLRPDHSSGRRPSSRRSATGCSWCSSCWRSLVAGPSGGSGAWRLRAAVFVASLSARRNIVMALPSSSWPICARRIPAVGTLRSAQRARRSVASLASLPLCAVPLVAGGGSSRRRQWCSAATRGAGPLSMRNQRRQRGHPGLRPAICWSARWPERRGVHRRSVPTCSPRGVRGLPDAQPGRPGWSDVLERYGAEHRRVGAITPARMLLAAIPGGESQSAPTRRGSVARRR